MARNTTSTGFQIRMTNNGRWAILREGAKAPSFRMSTQREAITRGTELAKRDGGPLTIYNCDGQIRRVYKFQS
jgi:hypothetical protein